MTFSNEFLWIKISVIWLKFRTSFVPFDNKSSLVQAMHWHRKGIKLLPEPIIVISLPPIFVPWPNLSAYRYGDIDTVFEFAWTSFLIIIISWSYRSCTWDENECSTADFYPQLTDYGVCFTFNSGNDGRSVRYVSQTGKRCIYLAYLNTCHYVKTVPITWPCVRLMGCLLQAQSVTCEMTISLVCCILSLGRLLLTEYLLDFD